MSGPRILLTGARGQLGFALFPALRVLGEVLPATRDGRLPGGREGIALDLAEAPARLKAALDRLAPRLIVNAAAYTAVDRAEEEPALARRVNAEAPAALAEWAEEHGALLIHFSTDYVFDGLSLALPWREEDPTGPLNAYGRSKLAGEEAVRGICRRHLILRSSWLYGPRGHNFLRTILARAARGDALRVVDDQVGSPTSVAVLAAATAQILARLVATDFPAAAMGTYHLACAGQASWYHFAEAILEEALRAGLLAQRPPLAPIATRDWPAKAERPAWSVLDGRKAEAVFGLRLPHWRVALADTITELAEAARAGAFLLLEKPPCPSSP
jgi:dTDP-4-dehydrorhamnose reductase